MLIQAISLNVFIFYVALLLLINIIIFKLKYLVTL
jgi:hypothetical protein